MQDHNRYIITQNVTGSIGVLPAGLSFRKILETIVTALVTGLFVLKIMSPLLPPIVTGAVFFLLCLIPSVLALTGLYSMTLFQFIGTLFNRRSSKIFFFRLPTEANDGALNSEEDSSKKKKSVKSAEKKAAKVAAKRALAAQKAEKKQTKKRR